MHLDGGERDAVRFELAATLAERFDAHLVGLYVVNPYVTVAMGGPSSVGVAELQHQYMDAMYARASTVKKQFTDWTDRRFPSSEWRFTEGVIRDKVAVHARYAELAIIGQGARDDTSATPKWHLVPVCWFFQCQMQVPSHQSASVSLLRGTEAGNRCAPSMMRCRCW